MSASLWNMITQLVLQNKDLRKRKAEEKAARLSLEAREKELERIVGDLRKEISVLKGILWNKGRKEAVVATPKKITPTEVHPTTPMTPVSPISFKWRRKRGGEEGNGSGSLVMEGGKRRKIEKEVGARVDPEKERGKGPVVGINVGGVVWLVGVEGVVAELGQMGFVICEGSYWLVDDAERGRRMTGGKTLSTVLAIVSGGKEVDALLRSGMWLAGRWCSIRCFLSVKPVRKVDRWRQVKVALEAGLRRVEKVYGLVEAFIKEGGSENGCEEVGEKDKGMGVETEMPSKEEKEEKVGFESKVKWERGSLFGEPSVPRKDTAKEDLSWAVGLGKLKEVEVGALGYCNSCRKMGGGIGSFCT